MTPFFSKDAKFNHQQTTPHNTNSKINEKNSHIIAAALILLSGCASNPTPPSITRVYDKYAQIEVTNAGPFDISRSLSWEINKGVSKSAATKSTPVFNIRFAHNGTLHPRSNEWQYLKNRQLYFLINENSHDFGSGKHTGEVLRASSGGVYVTEIIVYEIKQEHLDLLASGKSITGRIGSTEFVVTSEQQKIIQNLATGNHSEKISNNHP